MMPDARIDYLEAADRVTFVYRPAFSPVTPPALLWSLIGGLAVGVGLSVGLVAAGLLSIQDGPQGFRAALIAGTVLGSLLLLALGWVYGLRSQPLRITFDYARQRLLIRQPDRRRLLRVRFHQAGAFRLVENGSDGCTLLLESEDAPLLSLITVRGSCHDERASLPQLSGRLNAHLDALRAVPDEVAADAISD